MPGTTVSVLPWGDQLRHVTLTGLAYPLEDATLTNNFPLGVSNHFTGKAATIQVKDGSLLAMWDRKNGLPRR